MSLTARKVIVAAPQSTAMITPRCCSPRRINLLGKARVIEIRLCVCGPTNPVKAFRGGEPIGRHVEGHRIGLPHDLSLDLTIKMLACLVRGANRLAQLLVK